MSHCCYAASFESEIKMIKVTRNGWVLKEPCDCSSLIYSDTFTHFTIGLKSDLAFNFHWVFFVIIVSGINFLITFIFFTYIWAHEGHQWEWKTERRNKDLEIDTTDNDDEKDSIEASARRY